jgi:hypothetical protein
MNRIKRKTKFINLGDLNKFVMRSIGVRKFLFTEQTILEDFMGD